VNSIQISGGTSRSTAFFSYANTLSRGIIPGNTYRRDNVTLRQSLRILNDRVTISTNIMFSDEMSRNRSNSGFYTNPITGLYWFPRGGADVSFEGATVNRNIDWYKENWRVWQPNRMLYFMDWHTGRTNHYQGNPWWIMNMQPRWDGGKRVIAGATITWDIAEGLNFTVKGTYDYRNQLHEQRFFAGGKSVSISPNGSWTFRRFIDQMTYWDAVLTWNRRFGDISLNALAGVSYHETAFGDGVNISTGSSNALIVPNVFRLQNLPHQQVPGTTFPSRTIKEGYFGNATIGFRDMIYLDLSGRMDRSSTLALADIGVNYFYPAVGLSAIITQMVSLPNFITFGKVRGSYTTVANDVGFDNIIQRYGLSGRNVSSSGVSTISASLPTNPHWYSAKSVPTGDFLKEG
jgi:hypothetical protein